jgi:hypothetical protein
MAEDQIRYDVLTQDALRGVIRAVMTQVWKNGLPGQHHFFVAIDTTAAGVGISKRLQEQYPEEITIVLQHQFWDLIVHDDRFEVKLSFNNIPERLVVPYDAIKSFFDPSVQFGLQFGQTPSPSNDARKDQTALLERAAPEPDPLLLAPAAQPEPPEPEEERPALAQDDEKPAAVVVELDRFRKK